MAAPKEVMDAFKTIIAAIDTPESMDGDIGTITDYLTTVEDAPKEDGYKQRYEDLRDSYRSRFGELLEKQVEAAREETVEVVQEEEYTIDRIDFDGTTE